jgi:hypothetical protein
MGPSHGGQYPPPGAMGMEPYPGPQHGPMPAGQGGVPEGYLPQHRGPYGPPENPYGRYPSYDPPGYGPERGVYDERAMAGLGASPEAVRRADRAKEQHVRFRGDEG